MAKASSREEFLDVGWQMLGQGVSPADLKMQKIVDATPYSSGAFYGHWATLDDYLADLLRMAVRQVEADLRGLLDHVQHDLIGPAGPQLSLPDALSQHLRGRLSTASPSTRLWRWLACRDLPETYGVLRHGYHVMTDRWADILRSLISGYGLVDQPVIQLASTVIALEEGLANQDLPNGDDLFIGAVTTLLRAGQPASALT